MHFILYYMQTNIFFFFLLFNVICHIVFLFFEDEHFGNNDIDCNDVD